MVCMVETIRYTGEDNRSVRTRVRNVFLYSLWLCNPTYLVFNVETAVAETDPTQRLLIHLGRCGQLCDHSPWGILVRFPQTRRATTVSG